MVCEKQNLLFLKIITKLYIWFYMDFDITSFYETKIQKEMFCILDYFMVVYFFCTHVRILCSLNWEHNRRLWGFRTDLSIMTIGRETGNLQPWSYQYLQCELRVMSFLISHKYLPFVCAFQTPCKSLFKKRNDVLWCDNARVTVWLSFGTKTLLLALGKDHGLGSNYNFVKVRGTFGIT